MEPCAPGTEDDLPIMYSTLNKQETEQDRLLKQKAFLRNGRYENVFELSYVNGSEHWFCRACECPVMGRVFQHEIGKRHSQNLSSTNRHLGQQQKEEEEENRSEPEMIDIAPGEPVPPGFEDEIGRVSQIQEKLDGFKAGPLVALEYLFELQDYDQTKEPVYLCILCDKRGDPRTVLTHLASYNHISQYLQKHFPTCYRALAPYMTKQYKRNWQVTLQKVAEGIEKKFGRLKPYPIDKDKFEKERMHYLQMISKGKHFSEQSGYTFEELIVHDELTKSHEAEEKSHDSSTNWGVSTIQKPFKKRSPSPPVVAMPSKKSKNNVPMNLRSKTQQQPFISANTSNNSAPVKGGAQVHKPVQNRRRSLSSVSSISSNEDFDNSIVTKKQGDRFGRNRSPPSKGRQLPYARRRSPSPFSKRTPLRRRSPSPKRRSPSSKFRKGDNRSGSNFQKMRNDSPNKKPKDKETDKKKAEEEDKMRKLEEYRKLARAIENDMTKTLQQHEKNPEKHPQYNEEWKKFWNRRYKELQAQGVNVSKYDFKPEWIEFWNRRMVELHSDELRNRKDALRKRLALPEEINPVNFKITPKVNINSKPNLPMAAQPDQDDDVIIIDDKDDDVKPIKRSDSPWEREERPVKSRKKHSNSPIYLQRRSKGRSPIREERRTRRSRTKERVSNTSHSRDRSLSYSRDNRLRDFSPRSRGDLTPRSRDYGHKLSQSPPRADRDSRSRDGRGREFEFRERRSYSRERSWERRDFERKRLEYRESSYERDIRGRERVRTVADLPWEREKVYRNPYEDYYKPPPIMRDVTRQPVVNPEKQMVPAQLPPDEDDDDEVNVVDVLRILTALEERLGSLGPKVIDLLAQALALEKNEANSSETLLDNDINCVLFETIKEKLKGQLLTGLVDMIQERAFKKAIKKIASLIHMAGQRKRQRERLLPKGRAVTVPGVGNVDRGAIAKQIANALVAQGKTDVTQAELEQLINAVVGMAEKAKTSNQPVTTANFFQQITGEKPFEDKTDDPPEKIIIPSSYKGEELVDLEKLTEPLTPSPGKNSSKDMENLSDSDLQTLLQNFKDLSTDEQHNLISYLKKLEYQEPERVEKLRQFVNLGGSKSKEDSAETTEVTNKSGQESPFSNRTGGVNPVPFNLVNIESDEEIDDKQLGKNEENEKPAAKIHVDSEEEEDYTFDDVVKTVRKNVKDKEIENNMKVVEESMKFESSKPKQETDMLSAKDLISNLMSNISKNNSSSSIDLLGLGVSSSSKIPTSTPSLLTSTVDFAKTLSSISIDNLGSILSNVKNLTSVENRNKPLPFDSLSSLRYEGGVDSLSTNNRLLSPNLEQNRPDISFEAFDRYDRRFTNLERPLVGPVVSSVGPQVSRSLGNLAPNLELFGGPSISGQHLERSSGPNRDLGLNRDLAHRDLGLGRDFGPIRDSDLMFDQDQTRDFEPLGNWDLLRQPFGTNYGPGYGQQDRPGASTFSRNPVSAGYGNTRGPRPNMDQRNPRFSNFGRPGGNFNRW